MSNPNGSTSTSTAIPTAAQLAEARTKQWHQQGEALLTLENLRSWMNAAGLVLFTPRPQIVAPAPSLVEAVLGSPNSAPTIEQTAEARGLMARLVAEGLAVPLNLLGATGPTMAGAVGETPDFVATTAVFSYIFTLRGDKAWKQPPATSGAFKVSPLALAAHEAMARRGAISVYDLTTELGKEVTEAAVLRALGELWTHLRVLPLLQPEGPTLWELASARFTKQIKAGANAGQPAALSALISLYLGQAVVASEDEIESFLSPLAARSRIRDVIHALVAARQLDSIAVEGRTVLHVAGELPAFLAPAAVEASAIVEAVVDAPGDEIAGADGEGAPRITKYVPKPRKIGTGYLAKASPAKFGSKPFGGSKTAGSSFGAGGGKARAKTAFKPREGDGPVPDRERRPFQKPPIDYAARGFDKPWEEEKARRLAAAARPSEVADSDASTDIAAAASSGAAARPRAPRVYKPREGSGGDRGGKPSFGGKASFGRKTGFGSKPPFKSDGRPPRREFAPRADADGAAARPPRKTFSKPGTFARKREGFAARPERGEKPAFGGPRAPGSFTARPRFDKARGDRSERAEGDGGAPRKPYPPRGAGFFSAKPRPSEGRPERKDRGQSTESGKRIYPKFDARKAGPADRPGRTDGAKARGEFAPRRPAAKSFGASGGFAGKARAKPGGFAGKKPFGGSEARSGTDRSGGAKTRAAKPGGSFAKKPGSTFAKFADGNKPFGKRPPARKFKPKDDESA